MRPVQTATVANALSQSRLARLPADVAATLIADALLLDVPAGTVPIRQGCDATAGLMVSGLLRVFHTTVDGRQVTVRYARSGELLAINTLYVERAGVLSAQALTACRILMMRPATVRSIADRDPRVANLLAEELAYRLFMIINELAGNTFGTMRQRVVRHLLDIAAGATGQRVPLVARLTQQALADDVGSVREVVVRLLRELRDEGLIRTGRDEIEIIDADRLHAETFPRPEY
ncbi:MAG TPA: Crp/Fnr family transcriptional regulator [Steroidobacteraceae bacterium]|nr:Crp/Fnr family transcriptional regulator [Steroidobacteraceae bacterium]